MTGRPPLPPSERLSAAVRVSFTAATMRRVRAAARRARLSVPAWVRRAVGRALDAEVDDGERRHPVETP